MLPFTIVKILFCAGGWDSGNMVQRQLEEFFSKEGYVNIPSNLPEFTIFFRTENTCVNVFHVIYCREDLHISKGQYEHIKDKIRDLFLRKGSSQVHILSLIVCGNKNIVREICAEDTMCWVIDPYENRLLIYENQINNFYGMKDKLEDFLGSLNRKEGQEEAADTAPGRKKCRIPTVTAVLVAINILVFILCTFTGNLLYNEGAIGIMEFMGKKEYYRIITSLFLHWDINHLFSNMIVLYYLGEVVEGRLGMVRYGILYLAAGICGNLASVFYELYSGTAVFSAGASGAVFGVIGALFVLVISNRGHLKQITIGRLVFMVAYSLYSGFMAENVNNAAHIGGFISGITVTLVCFAIGRFSGKPIRNM